MANYTPNLNLRLPLGSKYWNYDTWNDNMRKLDTAVVDIQHIILDNLTASQIPVSNPRLNATNMQDAVGELKSKSASLRYINITEDCDVIIPSETHAYVVLTFGSTVYNVRFVKTTPTTRDFIWLNGIPNFEPNSSYEISFLKLSAIWYKRKWNQFPFLVNEHVSEYFDVNISTFMANVGQYHTFTDGLYWVDNFRQDNGTTVDFDMHFIETNSIRHISYFTDSELNVIPITSADYETDYAVIGTDNMSTIRRWTYRLKYSDGTITQPYQNPNGYIYTPVYLLGGAGRKNQYGFTPRVPFYLKAGTTLSDTDGNVIFTNSV